MQMKTRLAVGTVILLTGCMASSPVLSPNPRLLQAGKEQAQRDIEQCKVIADQTAPLSPTEQTAYQTATGAKRGEAVGVVGGAVIGSPSPAGAAAPARPTAVTPAWKEIVTRCLRERGYEVSGWQ
jgi:hypothetical protein